MNLPDFDNAERALIWDGLEALANDGRLKLITQVKKELGNLHPQGLQRLIAFPGHQLTVRRTGAVIASYQRIVAAYPDISPRPGRDPADPWLIVAALKYGYPIVTMELSREQRKVRSKKAQSKIKIPDICQQESIQCLSLRELAIREGWLPTSVIVP